MTLYNRNKQKQPGRSVNVTTAAVQLVSQTHANKVVTLNKADGVTLTLPVATGSGDVYRILVLTAITSVGAIIKVPDAASTMVGNAMVLQDGGDTMVGFEAGSTADTVTLNGSTTGGLAGHLVTLTDVAANKWLVESVGAATGVEASPFSATVS